MSKYKVEFKKSALKKLHKIPNKEVLRITSIIGNLSIDPRPNGCKKLKGFKDLWRVRSGNYRMIYRVEDQRLIVEVLEIADRKDAY